MTTEFEKITMGDVRAGDRLRLTHPEGDVHIFTVDSASDGYLYDVRGNRRYGTYSDFKVEREVPALPTNPGVYLPYPGQANGHFPNIWILNDAGQWFEVANTFDHAPHPLERGRIRDNLDTIVYLGRGVSK